MAGLREYEDKRRRGRTPEPFGGPAKSDSEPIFVVQRHAARRLHYDLRLERAGALASWAVPKGIPLEPGAQRLAVHVEDHPLEYADFEGEIPRGEYGAGTVEIWDRGTYELLEEKPNGGLTFRLNGERLLGTWALVPARLSGEEKNWLLLRKRDDSVALPKQERERRYLPMLATPSDELPKGGQWLFEVKFDGYRAIASVREAEATLTSRRGNVLDERFPSVAKEVPKAVKTPSCVLDGEVCALDEQGVARFSLLQQGTPETPLVYYVFDLLELEGEALLDRPLDERRGRLEELLDRRNATVRLSGAFDDGETLLAVAKEHELEGVIAKRADSRYEPGKRTRDWLKVKARGRQEFVIAGYTKGKGRRARSFGSLVLGVWRGDELHWVGNCGTGFTEAEIERLLNKLRPLERKASPFAVPPKMPRVRRQDVVWVTPKLVCEVAFAEWTHDGHLRAPSYVGLREDKGPREVRKEQPVESEIRRGKRVLRLSNLDKVFFPGEGITKGDLVDYYRAVAPVLVPHLAGRPFTMIRYPDGIEAGHFFQKDAPEHMPDWIATFPSAAGTRRRGRDRIVRYALVNDELALLWMVNMACIDMHAWYSRVDRPDRPDFVLFDLDPSEGVGYRETVRVACLVKEVLDALGLESFPKTSGAQGFHVLVPVARRYTYEDTRRFAEIVAGALARAHRGLVTTEWTKARRRGVYLDAKQNAEGATIAFAYSVRPRAGAPVSAPLRWEEVTEDLDPRDFTMEVVLGRAERYGDLYEGVLSRRQSLGDALRKLQA